MKWNQTIVNTASLGVIVAIAPFAVALSLPLSPPAPSLPAPSLPPFVPNGIEGQPLPAFVSGEDGVLIYPSQLPTCDHEDGTATHNGKSVRACWFDAGPTGTSFIVLRTHRNL